MSLNTAHVNGGVLIHSGECILLFSEDVTLDFSGTDTQAMKGVKLGRIYLTTHRMIFTNNKQNDALLSFSFPFVTLHDVELEQPVFGANYLKGKVRAQSNGNWIGEAKFKIIFKKGGCIDFAQAMLKAASMASRNASGNVPPPYSPPSGPWYQAPPPAYAPNPYGYYGWVPPTNAFPDQPPANSVFMTDMPPPYPGINPGYTGYAGPGANAPGSPPVQPPSAGFAPPPMMNGSGPAGASGFAHNGLSASEAKAAEAAQSAYYDPNKPQCAYVPPPAYYVLECRVCEDVFTIQGDRVPRLLYCGHTVCHACLLRLPLKEDTILCPFDRQATPVGSTGVWGLKKNFALLELLEKLELTDKEASYADKEVIRNHNDGWVGCDEDESHTAVVYCIVCRSHLCDACSLATHATRTLAPHKRVPLSEKPHEMPKCHVHLSHTAEFVCLKDECRAIAVCYLCKEYGRHKDHPHSLVEAEAEKLRTLLSTAVQRSHQLIDQMNQTERRLEEVMIGIEGRADDGGTLDAARTRVEHHFEELRCKLEMQAAAARSAVETHARERLATLRASQQDIATWLAQVMSVVVLCESSLGYDDAKLVSFGLQLKKAIDSIEKQHDQFSQLSPDQFNPDIPITFTKDNRVHIGPKIEMRVVALGLDGAGKTSILFKLKQNEFMSYRTPTIGFNVEPIEYKNLRFNIWDIGGQPKLRPLWKHYFLNTQAVVFVVDSSDKDRLAEAALELSKLVAEKDLKEAALLILVNKQDVEGSEGLEVVTEALGTSKLCCSHSWHALACSAQTGQGLYQGLDWLSSQLVASPITNYTSRESQSNNE